MDRPALLDVQRAGLDVEGLAEDVEDVALGHVADRHRDRRAGVRDLAAADETVGRLHRDRADQVVADVLGDLEGQRAGLLVEGPLDVQRVVDVGHGVRRELHVDDRADDPDDPAEAATGLVVGGAVSSVAVIVSHLIQ